MTRFALPRQPPLHAAIIFDALARHPDRTLHANDLAVVLAGRERPAAYRESIGCAVRSLRALLEPLGAGVVREKDRYRLVGAVA